MERLRQSELKSLLAFVRDCYAFRGPDSFESFLSWLVATLPQLIPAAHVTYNEMYPERSESLNRVNNPELATQQAATLWAQHMNDHPVMIHVLGTKDRHARRISDFLSRRQLHDRGLHSEFYRRYGIEDALCITIPCQPPRIIGVGWHDNRTFTDRERLIADLVRPHISQAWHNARLVSRWRNQLRLLRHGLEDFGAGVILCSPHGPVQFINTQAREYLADYMGMTQQTDHHLPQDLLLWMRAQAQPLSRIDDAPPVCAPLVFDKGDKRLIVRLLSQPDAYLILMEEQKMSCGAGTLATLGLTPRETEVLTWIARGKTNQDIAIILDTHTATVKKHVEHILSKLGVETRTAAAAMALACDQPGSPL
jgi:DNA-binding CsgD family transcriptional regulator